jgi:TolB-like protein
LLKPFFIYCILSLLILSGCASIGNYMGNNASHTLSMYQNATFAPAKSLTLELEDYVRELVADMTLNMRSLESSGAIGVTNFVFTGSDYQSSNPLGDALANTFMMQLHQFGFETLDFKVTDYIRITAQGDFAMSRDYLELDLGTPVEYVLVGTLSEHKKGYRVHARIVDIKSKKILAAGESFIPRKLVNTLLSNRFIPLADFTAEVSS